MRPPIPNKYLIPFIGWCIAFYINFTKKEYEAEKKLGFLHNNMNVILWFCVQAYGTVTLIGIIDLLISLII